MGRAGDPRNARARARTHTLQYCAVHAPVHTHPMVCGLFLCLAHLLRTLFLGRERACVVHRRGFSPDPTTSTHHAPASHILCCPVSSPCLFFRLFKLLAFLPSNRDESGAWVGGGPKGCLVAVIHDRRVETAVVIRGTTLLWFDSGTCNYLPLRG